jgi:hypothetical protein
MTSTSNKLTIEQLKDPEDYQFWALSAQVLMTKDKCWQAVQPLEVDEATTSKTPSKKDKSKGKDKNELTEEAENNATAFIITHVHNDLKPHIMDCGTAREMWETLAAICQTHQTSTIRLRRDLYQIRYEADKPMLEYIGNLKKCVSLLAKAGQIISPEEHVAILLAGLGNQLEGTRQSLEVLPDDKLNNLNYVQGALLRAGKAVYEGNRQDVPHAYVARDSNACKHCGKTNHDSHKCFSQKTCDNCNQKGHIARFCPKERREERRDERKGDKEEKCTRCGNGGHRAAKCWKNKGEAGAFVATEVGEKRGERREISDERMEAFLA